MAARKYSSKICLDYAASAERGRDDRAANVCLLSDHNVEWMSVSVILNSHPPRKENVSTAKGNDSTVNITFHYQKQQRFSVQHVPLLVTRTKCFLLGVPRHLIRCHLRWSRDPFRRLESNGQGPKIQSKTLISCPAIISRHRHHLAHKNPLKTFFYWFTIARFWVFRLANKRKVCCGTPETIHMRDS